jgi:beta-1,4-mannosyl-glycoprotein beta-1,4-N-acetylglucosaminyltransferase
MIYDVFSFNNELDMLGLRLEILSPYVDYFVLVEADRTFSGIKKPLYYDISKEKFAKFKDKIIHYKVEDSPISFTDGSCDQNLLRMGLESDNVTEEHICWLIEFYQKESVKKALTSLSPDDICIVSDVDEVWNPNIDFSKLSLGSIYKPRINNCYFEYLNVRTSENWTFFTGPIICAYGIIENSCLNHLRTQRKMNHIYKFIEDGGWHFNALGGSDKKISDFQHPVYSKWYMETRKSGSIIDEVGLPTYILENKEELRERGLFL